LEQQLGVDTFLNGGFNIYTTIDYRLEAYVESAVRRHLQQTELQQFPYAHYGLLSSPTYNLYDAAVVAMDAKTGEVLAMDGSTDYNSTNKEIHGNFNVAVNPTRSPGSTIKPIVYATAFQEGWYPGIVVPDFKTYFPVAGSGSPATCDFVHAYCPQDYNNQYSNSDTSIRSALANSRNVPAVKTLLYAGIGNVINMAQRFGITTVSQKHDSNLSFALGTSGIPLIQMVGAYQVFADNGVRVPPKSILDIWDNYGHHLYHYDPTHPGGIQVISPQVAFLMTSVLSDEEARRNEFWPDHDLSFWGNVGFADLPNPGYPNVAAKTGTTEDFRDNWTIGYTSGVVVGVWGGNADNSPMTTNVVGITGAAPIWHSVITYLSGMCNSANDGIPCPHTNLTFQPQTFTPPPGVTKQCVSTANGLASSGGGGTCDYMLDGEYPGASGVTNVNNNPTATPTP
jgi:membrane peptidoglycan carboxypeptidase